MNKYEHKTLEYNFIHYITQKLKAGMNYDIAVAQAAAEMIKDDDRYVGLVSMIVGNGVSAINAIKGFHLKSPQMQKILKIITSLATLDVKYAGEAGDKLLLHARKIDEIKLRYEYEVNRYMLKMRFLLVIAAVSNALMAFLIPLLVGVSLSVLTSPLALSPFTLKSEGAGFYFISYLTVTVISPLLIPYIGLRKKISSTVISLLSYLLAYITLNILRRYLFP